MNNFILSQKNRLLECVSLLEDLSLNLDNSIIDSKTREIFVKKLLGYQCNIDIIMENTLDLLKDIRSNKCNISRESTQMLDDEIEVLNFINEIKPFLIYQFYNRKYLMSGGTSGAS